jgi:hypothetical protein
MLDPLNCLGGRREIVLEATGIGVQEPFFSKALEASLNESFVYSTWCRGSLFIRCHGSLLMVSWKLLHGVFGTISEESLDHLLEILGIIRKKSLELLREVLETICNESLE